MKRPNVPGLPLTVVRIRNLAHRLRFGVIPTFILASAILSIASGCSTPHSTVSSAGADSILNIIRAGYSATPTLALEGNVKVSGVPATIWFDGAILRHDSLRVTLTGPFGIDVGAMSASPSHFLFYNAPQDEAYEGPPTSETFKQLIMIGLDYDELVSLLRAEAPNLPLTGTYSSTMTGSTLIVTTRRNGIEERYTIDPSVPDVEKYVRASMAGDTLKEELAVSFSNISTQFGRPFAKKATVVINGGEQTVWITIERIHNEAAADFIYALDLPPGTTRHRL